MSNAVTERESELFASSQQVLYPSQRAVVMRDTDVRLVFAAGRLARPSSYYDVTPQWNTPHEWMTIAADPVTSVAVTDPKRACLVVFKSSSKVGARLASELPSVEIEAVLFPSDAALRQWSAKSRTFDGLPQPLPVRLDVLTTAQFETASSEGEPRWVPADPPECNRDEQDRVAGGLVGAFVRGDLSRVSWNRVVALQNPSKIDLEDLWCSEHEVERGAVAATLNVLADANWGVGFDPTQMLGRLHEALLPHYAPPDLEVWHLYVANILSNREVANPDGLRDGGKTLLRALELFMRTPQPSIGRIADEIRVRDARHSGAVGRHVGGQALALAGWFEGFAATGSIVKHDPGLYGIGCRVAASSKAHPTRFELRSERVGAYGRRIALLESGNQIAEVQDDPPPLLLDVLNAAQELCSRMSWTFEFEEECRVIHIRHSDWELCACVADRDVLCWKCDVDLPRSPKQRTWPKGFVDWVFATAGERYCVVGSPSGFPRLEIRHRARLEAVNEAEVQFAVKALLGTRERLLAWRALTSR